MSFAICCQAIKGSFISKKRPVQQLSVTCLHKEQSPRVFLQDGKARQRFRDKLAKNASNKYFVNLIPDTTQRPNPTEYTVQYAIITKSTADWPASLPFFNQLNLMQNTRLLQELGYKVTLQRIGESLPLRAEIN